MHKSLSKPAPVVEMSLEERLKASIKAAAPSMNPAQPAASQPKGEKLPDIREVVSAPSTRVKIGRLVSLYIQHQQAEAEARKAKEEVGQEIKDIIGQGTKFSLIDGTRVNYYQTTRSTIDKMLLLNAGVPVHTIQACTKTTESWGLKVTQQKDNGD